MKKHNIIICTIIACLVCAGAAALYTWSNGKSPEPALTIPEVEAATEVDINKIPDITVIPTPIVTPSEPEPVDDPLPEPEQPESETVISLTEPVERPAEADTDIHEKSKEKEPPEPPVVKPQTPAPQQPSGPQGGEVNRQGQTFVPGFGWVTPGSGNQVKQGHSDGDINKQIGEM